MAEEAACGEVGNIVVKLVTLIGRQLRYVFCYKGNIKKMKIEVDRLEARRTEVKLLVDAANNNCHVVGSGVELWLKSVEEKMNEVDLVLSDIEKIGKGCLNEWCLHLTSRYWLSRKTTKRTLDLVDLLAQGHFSTVAYPPPALGMVPTSSDNNGQIELVVLKGHGDSISGTTSNPASVMGSGITSTSTGISGELKSRSAILGYVMEAVRDVNIHTIGICGMGGVGKTTLVKEVGKRAKEEGLFDEIVFVPVSKNPDMKSIQLVIADFLGLKFTEDSVLARASRLHERLNQKKGLDGKPKRILVLLDDLWDKLDLEDVGIRYPDDPSGCKIVLTSRSRDVCQQMKAAPFDIELLREEEAWSLFQNFLHPIVSYPIGKAIVAECRGLPIAITTIAALLANKEENTWKYVLQKLETSSLQGPYKKVYTVFQVSYDKLEPQEVKDVFLLCCLFPEDSDIPIEDIARYGMGLKVFKKIDNLHEARVAAYAHVEALKKLNLLLESEKPESVKMHDLVRDFGLSIASEDKFLVQFDSGLKRRPVEDTEERCTHISMQCDGINELPNRLNYSNVKLLRLMCTNVSPFNFPERLDQVAGRLQVLDLRRMRVPSILESVESLTNLRTLSLTGCDIKVAVPGIGNLMQLEILSFAHSTISELPREVGKLSRLRLLDLTGCFMLQKITPGILLGLTSLEELYMRGTRIRWAGEYSLDEEICASFSELEQLCNLVAIEINIPYQLLPTKVNLESLEKFMITFGGENDLRKGFESSFSLKGDEIVRFEGLLKALCKKTKFLHVSVKDLVNLRNVVEGKDLSRLNTLIFEDCDELACVFDGPDQSFNISSSSLLLRPFGNLRELTLTRCGNLKSVCPPSIARGFVNLEILEISYCSSIEEIISYEAVGDEDEQKLIDFLKLKALHLIKLPNLISFCKVVDHEVKLPQLEFVTLQSLPKLTSIGPEMKILGSSDSQHASSTEHPLFHQKGFQNMKKIKVIGCNSLKRILPLSFTRGMDMLEKVIVRSCDMMEEIFSEERGGGEDEETSIAVVASKITFPKLIKLELKALPNLVSFCRSVNLVTGPQLDQLKLIDVPKLHGVFNGMKSLVSDHKVLSQDEHLATIFPANMVQQLHNLYRVEVERNHVVEVVFDFEAFKALPWLYWVELRELPKLRDVWRKVPPHIQGFYNLYRLVVEECSSLRYLLTTSMAKALVGLKLLKVSKCNNLESIVSEEEENESAIQQLVLFPQLYSLTLKDLPKLSTIASKTYTLNTRILEISCVGDFSLGDILQQNLERLEVEECSSLRYVLTTSMAKALVGLTHLKVSKCNNLESIVSEEEENESAIEQLVMFPQLDSLTLKDLPKLSTIAPKTYTLNTRILEISCVGVSALGDILQQVLVTNLVIKGGMEKMMTVFRNTEIPQLSCLAIQDCAEVKVIFDLQGLNLNEGHHQAKAFSQLENNNLTSLPKLTSVWKNAPHVIQGFHNLKRLEVEECSSLRYLLTTSMAKALVGLKYLEVSKCNNLESIVSEEEENESAIQQLVLFPQLFKLTLKDLPKLSTIAPKTYTLKVGWLSISCVGDFSLRDILQQVLVTDSLELHIKGVMEKMITVFQQIEIPQLSGVAIKDCAELEVVFDFRGLNLNEGHHQAKAFSLRKYITLKRLPKLTSVWKNAPNVIQGFQNLGRLEIVDCDSLRHLFTPSQAKTLVSLTNLTLTSCKSLEAIVIEEEGEKEEEAEEVILFPKLFYVILANLPSLLTGLPKPYTFNSTISRSWVEKRLKHLLWPENDELSD